VAVSHLYINIFTAAGTLLRQWK